MTNISGSSRVAAAVAVALGLAASAVHAADASKEKCYGIRAAGQNDCASSAAGHSCHNKSTRDFSKQDWGWVQSGKCAQVGGSTAPGGTH